MDDEIFCVANPFTCTIYAHTHTHTQTFYLPGDDLNAVLGKVEGVVEGDGVCEVPQDKGLVLFLQEPHASRTQHIERGLGPLQFRNVTLSKVQEWNQTLVCLFWVLYVCSYTCQRGGGGGGGGGGRLAPGTGETQEEAKHS